MIIECAGYSHEFDDAEFDAWADACWRRLNMMPSAPGLAWADLPESLKAHWRRTAGTMVREHLLHLRYYPLTAAPAIKQTRAFMNKELGCR